MYIVVDMRSLGIKERKRKPVVITIRVRDVCDAIDGLIVSNEDSIYIYGHLFHSAFFIKSV